MSEDLLLGLETTAPVVGRLENVEDLLRVLSREVKGAVEGVKGSVSVFETIWRRMVLEVAKGRTAEMQAARPRLLSAFEQRFHLLKQTLALTGWLSKLNGTDAPDSSVLAPEIEGMERLKTRVFDRWQTVDDLEKLAVEHYPLSQSRLQQIAGVHAPPPEWYQGEEERLFGE